jgi:hypothetical protein
MSFPQETDIGRGDGARRCAHAHPSGRPCGGFAVAGSPFCFAHDPDQEERRAEARRRGGQAGKAAVVAGPDRPVRSLADVVGLVEATINDVRAGRLDVRVANAVGVLAGVAIRAIQQGELERRLEALEAVLEPPRAEAVARRRAS